MRSSRVDMITLTLSPWVRKGYPNANSAYLVQNTVQFKSTASVIRRRSAVERLEKLRKNYIPAEEILETIKELDRAVIHFRT